MTTKPDYRTGGYVAYSCLNGRPLVTDGATRSEARMELVQLMADSASSRCASRRSIPKPCKAAQ